MVELLKIINDWLGIILFMGSALLYLTINWKEAKNLAKAFIFEAERRARKQWLEEDGEKKKAWVINQYDLLPIRVRSTLSIIAPIMRLKNGEDVWEWLIQSIFNWLRKKTQKTDILL